jgi:tRNA(fMet)-specific endonuclease VapC
MKYLLDTNILIHLIRLRKKGTMISDFDLFIGSTAIANELIMVTENVKEFERISGITIENWVIR